MIWAFVSRVFGGLWGYLAAAGAAIVGILVVFHKGSTSGANEVIVKTTEKELANVKTAQKVEQRIASEQPSAVQQQLRDKYSRD